MLGNIMVTNKLYIFSGLIYKVLCLIHEKCDAYWDAVLHLKTTPSGAHAL